MSTRVGLLIALGVRNCANCAALRRGHLTKYGHINMLCLLVARLNKDKIMVAVRQ